MLVPPIKEGERHTSPRRRFSLISGRHRAHCRLQTARFCRDKPGHCPIHRSLSGHDWTSFPFLVRLPSPIRHLLVVLKHPLYLCSCTRKSSGTRLLYPGSLYGNPLPRATLLSAGRTVQHLRGRMYSEASSFRNSSLAGPFSNYTFPTFPAVLVQRTRPPGCGSPRCALCSTSTSVYPVGTTPDSTALGFLAPAPRPLLRKG